MSDTMTIVANSTSTEATNVIVDATGIFPRNRRRWVQPTRGAPKSEPDTMFAVFRANYTQLTSPIWLLQAYFWTEEWQEGEREADEDLRLRRTRQFGNIEDALAWLRS